MCKSRIEVEWHKVTRGAPFKGSVLHLVVVFITVSIVLEPQLTSGSTLTLILQAQCTIYSTSTHIKPKQFQASGNWSKKV